MTTIGISCLMLPTELQLRLDGQLALPVQLAGRQPRRRSSGGELHSLEMMLFNLGLALMIAGDLDESKPLFRESLGIARQIDDRVALPLLLDADRRLGAIV